MAARSSILSCFICVTIVIIVWRSCEDQKSTSKHTHTHSPAACRVLVLLLFFWIHLYIFTEPKPKNRVFSPHGAYARIYPHARYILCTHIHTYTKLASAIDQNDTTADDTLWYMRLYKWWYLRAALIVRRSFKASVSHRVLHIYPSVVFFLYCAVNVDWWSFWKEQIYRQTKSNYL